MSAKELISAKGGLQPTKSAAKTAAQEAFAACGLSYEQVARRVDVSPGYLRGLLRRGCDCYVTADRIRRALGCPVEYLLPRPKADSPRAKSTNKNSNTERGTGRRKAARANRLKQENGAKADRPGGGSANSPRCRSRKPQTSLASETNKGLR